MSVTGFQNPSDVDVNGGRPWLDGAARTYIRKLGFHPGPSAHSVPWPRQRMPSQAPPHPQAPRFRYVRAPCFLPKEEGECGPATRSPEVLLPAVGRGVKNRNQRRAWRQHQDGMIALPSSRVISFHRMVVTFSKAPIFQLHRDFHDLVSGSSSPFRESKFSSA